VHSQAGLQDAKSKERTAQKTNSVLQEMNGALFSAHIEVFGSSSCELAARGSDLDMAFSRVCRGSQVYHLFTSPQTELKNVAERLQCQYREMHVQRLLHARVLIVNIQDEDTGIEVDLSTDNTLGVWNSQLLLEYVSIDVRFAQIVVLVKAWASAHGIQRIDNNWT